MEDKGFEEALPELESIVKKLEEGDLSLDESLRLFEEGVRLSRYCNQKLEEAEKKIEILMKNEKGDLEKRPFNEVVKEDIN